MKMNSNNKKLNLFHSTIFYQCYTRHLKLQKLKKKHDLVLIYSMGQHMDDFILLSTIDDDDEDEEEEIKVEHGVDCGMIEFFIGLSLQSSSSEY